MSKTNILYWIWMNSLIGINPGIRFKLIQHFGDAEAIWNATYHQLQQVPFLTASAFKHLTSEYHKKEAKNHLERALKDNIQVIDINNTKYPYYLKNIYDPPLVLYVKGELVPQENALAVVGSRKATDYGNKAAEELAFELSCLGITVVSGMARGIDSAAHKGALKASGRTIAVLGCGIDIIYPAENWRLAGNIPHNGAIISEYPPGTPPLPRYFPLRNRIISGISLGVIVIEAGERSGSLITVNYALDQGREVFALPGNINSLRSVGTNRLIRDGAKVVTCVEDILEELKAYNIVNNKIIKKVPGVQDESYYKGLDADERKIMACMQGETVHVDVLAQMSGLPVQQVNAILTMLELKALIEQKPGKFYRIR